MPVQQAVQTPQLRMRAGAVVFEQGHLLLHRVNGDMFWALPGGKVEPGEEARRTIVRELVEELGVQALCNELLSVGENFFEHGGVPHHEIGLYFSVTLPSDSPVRVKTAVHVGKERGRRLEFRWFPLQRLQEPDLRPAVLRQHLSAESLPPHVVQRG